MALSSDPHETATTIEAARAGQSPSEYEPGEETFDAFISYSTADSAFAASLGRTLRAFTPPGGLDLPERTLAVFIYEDEFAGVNYRRSLQRYLERSRSLIVICSPDAAASEFVDDEIRRFVQVDPASRTDRVIPVLYRGLPNNEAGPGQEALRAFPPALVALHDLPIAANYLGFDADRDAPDRGVYANGWYTLLANSFGVSRSVIEDRHRRRLARRRRIQTIAATIAVAVLSATAGFMWYLRSEALTQRQAAEQATAEKELQRKDAVNARGEEAVARAAAETALDRANAALADSIWHQLDHAEPAAISAEELNALWMLVEATPPVREAFLGNATRDGQQAIALGRRPGPILHAAFTYWGQERQRKVREVLFRALEHETDADRVAALANSLAAVPGSPDATQAQALFDRTLARLDRATTRQAFVSLAAALASLARCMPVESLHWTTQSIVRAVGQARAVPALAPALDVLVHRISDHESRLQFLPLLVADVGVESSGRPRTSTPPEITRAVHLVVANLPRGSLTRDEVHRAVVLLCDAATRAKKPTQYVGVLRSLMGKLAEGQHGIAFDALVTAITDLEGNHIGPVVAELTNVLSDLPGTLSVAQSQVVLAAMLRDIADDQETFEKSLDRDVKRDVSDNDFIDVMTALMAKVPPSQTRPLAVALLDALSDASLERERDALAAGLGSLAEKLAAADLPVVLAPLVDVIQSETGQQPFRGVVPAAAPRPVRLDPEQAHAVAESLLSGVASRLDASQRMVVLSWAAGELVRPDGKWVDEAPALLSAFGDGLREPQVAEAVATLSRALAVETSAPRKAQLAEAVEKLRRDSGAAAAARARAASLIDEEMRSGSGWSLAPLIRAVPGQLAAAYAEDLSGRLVQALRKPIPPQRSYQVDYFVNALSAVVEKSPASVGSRALADLVAGLSQLDDPNSIAQCAAAINAIAAVPIRAALLDETLSGLLRRLGERPDGDQSAVMEAAASALTSRVPAGHAPATMAEARSLLAWAPNGTVAALAARAIAAAAARRPVDTFVATLVDALKYPTAIGEARDGLLRALTDIGSAAPPPSNSLESTLEWVSRSFPALDLSVPPRCPPAHRAGLFCPAPAQK